LRAKAKDSEPASIRASLRKLFNLYDRDKSGTLDLTEIKKLLVKLKLSDVDAQTLISQSDTDHDGSLNFEEFYSMLQNSDNPALDPTWRLLKYWLQLSSGWVSAPKTPAEVAELKASDPSAKLISFIRHGESEANAAIEITGSSKGYFNPDITAKGRDQARTRRTELAKSPDLFKFELIVVSPMRRTLETCHLALEDYINSGVKLIGHPLIREQFSESDDVGAAPKEIKAQWPNVDWSNFTDEPEVWWYPGQNVDVHTLTVEAQRALNMTHDWEEPWEVVLQRASDFEEWLRQRPEAHICVVSHGGFIEALVGPRMGNAEHCVLRL